MKILITGAAGFIGSHCCEHFSRKGYQVIAVDNLMRSTIFGSKQKSVEYNWEYIRSLKGVLRYKKDIRDAKAMDDILKVHRVDAVIHTAGQPGVRYSLENPLEDLSINTTGTLILLDTIARRSPKAKFVYCSTNKVYGDHVNDLPIEAKSKRYQFKGAKAVGEQFGIDLTGHTPYGVSKLAGDLYVQDYAYAFGLDTAVFRMSCIYGTRQFGFEDQGWLAWFTIRLLAGQPVTLYGDGKQIRDVLWVGDLIRAYEAFIDSKPLAYAGQVFNVGGGSKNTLSLLELIDHLEDITGKKIKVKMGDWRQFDQKVYVSDISKLRKTFVWAPKIAPREGIERLVSWVSANQALFKGLV